MGMMANQMLMDFIQSLWQKHKERKEAIKNKDDMEHPSEKK
jgi:hypothetical protein